MNMDWNFGKRTGNMEISKFDDTANEGRFEGGLSFKGKMCAPGVSGCGGSTPSGNHFGGKLTGQQRVGDQDLNGSALGSFARGPSNYDQNGKPIKGSTPDGAMGNWQVGNEHYKASGVFAGKRN